MVDAGDEGSDGGEQNGGAVFYEIARWRLEEQLGRVDTLDNKMAATFTLNAAVIALFAAAVAFRGAELSSPVWALALSVAVVFAANIICTFLAFRIRPWEVLPHLRDLQSVTRTYTDIEVRRWASDELVRAYFENEPELGRKATWVRRATALTAVELVLVVATALSASTPW